MSPLPSANPQYFLFTHPPFAQPLIPPLLLSLGLPAHTVRSQFILTSPPIVGEEALTLPSCCSRSASLSNLDILKIITNAGLRVLVAGEI